MSSTALARAVGLYTVALALGTVAIAVFFVGSGMVVLGLAAFGILFAVLGGASGGSVDSGIPNAQSSSLGEGESVSFANDGSGSTSWRFPGRVMLLFYGLGLAVWSVLALATLGGQLA
jgi:hypothetical protein